MTTRDHRRTRLSLSSIETQPAAHVAAEMKVKTKVKAAANDFEAMFLNTMFQADVHSAFNGDGPRRRLRLAQGVAVVPDRSIRQVVRQGRRASAFASEVYRELLKQQGVKTQ